ncbi:PDZ domain-containing protein [Stenotrophomonas maltophilia group sp. Smal35]|uniref:PDZ domain-containing protein n=1 Tax=Stenotrophomonas maltophilia group sp. Smal35 TaxID=3377163 RepID=UPI002555E456|nr:PDZ domain-containing protein [Stenotrophomonas maltophilia]
MRTMGFLLVAIGFVMLLVSCNMDVSVATDFGTRVNNIGLMHQQTMLVTISLGLMLVGTIMWIAGRRRPAAIQSGEAVVRAYTPEEMRDLDVLLADMGWTGISLRADDPKVVHSVADGSAAADAGIIAGDRVVQIDGQFTGNDLRENIIRLSGEHGAPTNLTIRRGSASLKFEVDRR